MYTIVKPGEVDGVGWTAAGGGGEAGVGAAGGDSSGRAGGVGVMGEGEAEKAGGDATFGGVSGGRARRLAAWTGSVARPVSWAV
jgi:hypothetical protein